MEMAGSDEGEEDGCRDHYGEQQEGGGRALVAHEAGRVVRGLWGGGCVRGCGGHHGGEKGGGRKKKKSRG